MESQKKRVFFIINPIAGGSSKDKIEHQINQLIDKSRFDFKIEYTKCAGHAFKLAHKAAVKGVDIVCAVGGDGTINETARALIHTDTALAIIPCGSGNGLARHLHIPMSISKALEVLNTSDAITIDYGVANETPFFCTCGVGFDAFISLKFAQSGKRGALSYIENILRNGLNYHPKTYDIRLDDDEEKQFKAYILSCANASQYGNNAYIAPLASVKDGLLDVTIVEPFNFYDVPGMALQMFNGTLHKNSKIKTFKCKKVTIHRDAPGEFHFDGEPKEGPADIQVEIIQKGLKCVFPAKEGPTTIINSMGNYFNEQWYNVLNFFKLQK